MVKWMKPLLKGTKSSSSLLTFGPIIINTNKKSPELE